MISSSEAEFPKILHLPKLKFQLDLHYLSRSSFHLIMNCKTHGLCLQSSPYLSDPLVNQISHRVKLTELCEVLKVIRNGFNTKKRQISLLNKVLCRAPLRRIFIQTGDKYYGSFKDWKTIMKDLKHTKYLEILDNTHKCSQNPTFYKGLRLLRGLETFKFYELNYSNYRPKNTSAFIGLLN